MSPKVERGTPESRHLPQVDSNPGWPLLLKTETTRSKLSLLQAEFVLYFDAKKREIPNAALQQEWSGELLKVDEKSGIFIVSPEKLSF